MAYRKLDPFIYETLTRLGANPLTTLQHKNKSINIDLNSGARMDVKIDGLTLFEAAVDMCDREYPSSCEYLRYILAHSSSNNLAMSHVHEVLE